MHDDLVYTRRLYAIHTEFIVYIHLYSPTTVANVNKKRKKKIHKKTNYLQSVHDITHNMETVHKVDSSSKLFAGLFEIKH